MSEKDKQIKTLEERLAFLETSAELAHSEITGIFKRVTDIEIALKKLEKTLHVARNPQIYKLRK